MTQYKSVVYDDSPDILETGQLELMPGLTAKEIIEAEWMATLSKGVMIVTGEPRSGKDLFGNVFSWKMKRYFGKEILRDEAPRSHFGNYIPFNRGTVNDDLQEMAEVLAEKNNNTNRTKMQKMSMLADEWLEHTGNALLKNKVLYLTEFGGYMHNRAPMSPMNIFLGRILRRWGHLDLLVIGTTQLKHELDKYTCLPWVTHEVRCKWSFAIPNTGLYHIHRVRTVTSAGAISVRRKMIRYVIDGGESREVLDGKRYFDLFNSKSAPMIKPSLTMKEA